jgi:hypothetical protein
LLRLDDSSWLSLVINTKHFTPHFEVFAFRGHGKWLEELQLALAVEDMLGVELGHAFNGRAVRTRVEVNDFLVGVLEGKDDGVGWESGEVGVELLQKVSRYRKMR